LESGHPGPRLNVPKNQSSASDEQQAVKLIFELTNLCNFSCTHCIREEPVHGSFLPFEVVEKVLAETQPYHNVNYVAFTGGEPTLHPDFAKIVQLVTTYGYRFGFVTNGWLFRQRTFPQIQPYLNHLAHVTFSLDGSTEETHDALRRRRGSFRRLMEAILLCNSHGIPVHINMVVTQLNHSQLEGMAMLASRLGCDGLFYGHCQPTPDAVAASLVLNTRERCQVETEIAQLQRVFRLNILLAGDHYNPSPFYQCSQLRMREFNIDYRGYLTACCMLSNYRGGTPDSDVIADLNEVSFYEAHQRLVAKIAQIHAEKIDRFSTRQLDEKDHFICTHCLEHYGKLCTVDNMLALPPL
jgi:MoaA/NifB/PqqE/SkfB family radical SAM enzyme